MLRLSFSNLISFFFVHCARFSHRERERLRLSSPGMRGKERELVKRVRAQFHVD